MKYIAIDDEPMALDIITDYASKVSFLEKSGTFRDAISALNYLQQNHVDLMFLDINMPDLNGIQMLKTLQYPPLVIFTTAYSEYAIEGYQFHAIDYLLKPIELNNFLIAVNHAFEQFQLKNNKKKTDNNMVKKNTQSEDFIWVKSGTEYFNVKLEDILFIKSEGNYIEFHLVNKRIVALDSLNNLIQTLPEGLFVRTHKSYIISIKQISSYERHQVKIKNENIPVGSLYRESFLNTIK